MTEYEPKWSQFHVQRIEDLAWDALNEALVVVARVGPPNGSHSSEMAFSLSPEAAQSLADVLPIALEERPGATAPMQ